jgi:hypothetical protein
MCNYAIGSCLRVRSNMISLAIDYLDVYVDALRTSRYVTLHLAMHMAEESTVVELNSDLASDLVFVLCSFLHEQYNIVLSKMFQDNVRSVISNLLLPAQLVAAFCLS